MKKEEKNAIFLLIFIGKMMKDADLNFSGVCSITM